MRERDKESKKERGVLQEHGSMPQVQQTLRIPISGKEYVEVPSIGSDLTRIDVGFTGTREGMTPKQQLGVISALKLIRYWAKCLNLQAWAHHGDCKGSDEEFHNLAHSHGYKVHIHPPINKKLRAFCGLLTGDVLSMPRDYTSRDVDIVEESLLLLATPYAPEKSQPYSGTWKTIRIARGLDKPHVIFWPNGEVEIHGN